MYLFNQSLNKGARFLLGGVVLRQGLPMLPGSVLKLCSPASALCWNWGELNHGCLGSYFVHVSSFITNLFLEKFDSLKLLTKTDFVG